MWMRKIIGLLVALSAVLPALAQPVPSVDELVRRGRAAGVNAELVESVRARAADQGVAGPDAVRLLEPAVVLAEAGLPSQHVLQKALEGLAKQVPPQRVGAVLAAMERHTTQAGAMLDPWLRRPDVAGLVRDGDASGARGASGARHVLIENLAQALQQNLPASTAQAVLDALPEQARRRGIPASELGAALGILSDLPTSADDAAGTAQLVVSALDAGFGASELRRLPAAVRAAERRSNTPPGAVARSAAAQMKGGRPADEILTGLFRGPSQGGPPGQAGPPDGVGPDERGRGQGGGQGAGPGGSGNPGRGNGPPAGRGPGGGQDG